MGQALFSNEEARGGSAWGAGTLANGDGSRQPSKVELDLAEYQVIHLPTSSTVLCCEALQKMLAELCSRQPPQASQLLLSTRQVFCWASTHSSAVKLDVG